MNETKVTTVTDIEWNMGKAGWLHPVVVFEPVEFDGLTITKCELHKSQDIRKWKLGIGDKIVLYYTNNGIVKIVENQTESDSYGTIQRCPFCHTLVKLNDENLYCNYPYCKETRVKNMLHFVKAMGIKGINREYIKRLIYQKDKHFPCRTPIQLINIGKLKLMSLFGDADGSSIYQSIQDAKFTTLAKFIWAMDITVEEYAKRLADDCNGDVDLFLLRCKNDHDWSNIKDFAAAKSKQINSTVKLHFNEIQEIRKKLIFNVDNQPEQVDFCTNKRFVVTGGLHIFKNRNAILSYIEFHGGTVMGMVTKNTSYVVNNDLSRKNPKNKDAALFNIPVITEDEFVARCKGEM